MARDSLTGSRIRERRQIAGLRQAELARQVGISASYINLIEHNRRRIGGKLLLAIARVLRVDPSLLTEGAEAALVASLRQAAAEAQLHLAEAERAEDLAARFPGWAGVVAAQQRRIQALERSVQTLSDRLTHDPNLAESLHEVLSTAAAIRSTAAILAEPGELETAWRDRFHRNLDQDSARLAASSKALMTYLDESSRPGEGHTTPQEEAEAFVAAHRAHFPEIEEEDGDATALAEAAPELTTTAARLVVRQILRQYAADAQAVPLDRLRLAVAADGLAPLDLAEGFGVGVGTMLRRLATLPEADAGADLGLVICDGSGSVVFRKPVEGFTQPRFGSSCPLWPLYLALSRPMTPLRQAVYQTGREGAVFDCFAIAEPVGTPAFNRDPLYRSTMLIVPTSPDQVGDPAEVGAGCHICNRHRCPARREPSMLSEVF